MKVIYEPGDVVKLEDTEAAGNFYDCKAILLHKEGEGFYEGQHTWKVKVYPDEGFAEEDSIGVVDERFFIPNFENLK